MPGPDTSQLPSSSFLIINSQLFPIEHVIVNIGRTLDNHLVIRDATVSRLHAQIRYDDGEFTIYDLNSTGGTFVNGERVAKRVLKSGDNIMLAAVPIVFVQDVPQLAEQSEAKTDELNIPRTTSPTEPLSDEEQGEEADA